MANECGTFLAYRNWVEEPGVLSSAGATVVPGSVLTTTADIQGTRLVTNLATRESDDSWRFLVATAATSATVSVDFGQDREVQCVTSQFPRHRYTDVSEDIPIFAATDTIQYQLFDSLGAVLYDSTVVVSGVDPGYMVHYIRLDAALTNVRRMDVTFDAISRETLGFCDVGQVGAWPIIEPNVNFSYPAGYGWKTNTNTQTTSAGRLYTARFDPMRRWSLDFDYLSNDESMVIDEMTRYSGGARQVFVVRGDLPTSKDAMHALVEARDIRSRTPTLRQAPLSFNEFI